MPPRKAAPKKAESGDLTEEGQKIVALCHIMMSCETFNISPTELTAVLGIAHPKNV